MEENHSLDQRNSAQTTSLSSPEAIEEMLQQALACLDENRLAEAGVIYQEVLKVQPDNIYACFNLGMIWQSNGELSAAISCYGTVLEQEPDNFQVLYQLANAYRDQGCLEKAAATYNHALTQDYDRADIHYDLGLIHYQQGDLEAARSSYQQAVKLDPAHANAFYNLGLIHFEQGGYDLSITCYEQALASRPDDIDTHYNLAVTLTKQGKLKAAADHYRKILALDPDDAELHNSFGLVCKQLRELDRAEACFRKAISLRPDYGAAYINLAIVLQTVDKIDQASECYAKAIDLGHQAESAAYMLAALTGSGQDSAPRDYVRDLFDSYADNFDDNLTGDLGYNSPELLREIAGELLGSDQQFSKIADLGCGTGLVGGRFRDIAKQMIGVDLSAKMLDKAAEKGNYDQLHCGEIVEFLDEYDGVFDLIVVADVLIYLGDLAPFFASVQNRIGPGGHLLFTVEELQGAGDHQLQASGRYAYAKEYLLGLAEEYGFSVEACRRVDLRKEKGQWLQGYLFVLQKN
ncbi:MAG: tetratricopeptide repeat protein [Thermodesulfobacteriota bacterium]